jgi:hypothetical protein
VNELLENGETAKKKTHVEQEDEEALESKVEASREKVELQAEAQDGADDFEEMMQQPIDNRSSWREERSEIESPEIKADMYKDPKLRDVYL